MTIHAETTQFPLLISLELTIAQIYRSFAEQFPRQAAFWYTLVKEEREHADWLIQLKVAVEDGLAGIAANPYDEQTLIATRQHLDAVLARARARGYTAEEAIAIALEIEASILENQFYAVIDEQNQQLHNIYTKLSTDTASHFTRLQEFQQALTASTSA